MAKNQGSNPDIAQQAAEDAVFGSSESFFDALDKNVNGMIREDSNIEEKEATPEQDPQVTMEESGVEKTQNSIDWEKRYSDSTREAQRMKAELDELKPYVPVLDAMKKDNGLVEHVKGYFNSNEGNLKESLKLDDDFRFDTDELIDNPESKSRKVFNAMVDGIVKERTSEMLSRENAQRQQQANKAKIQQDAEDFRVRNNLSVDEMKQFLNTAENRFKGGYLSFDDMYSLINRDNVNQNVAKATKEDMLTQMKNVREIPTSQGNANNAGKKQSIDDDVFDALRGVDSKIDNLFG